MEIEFLKSHGIETLYVKGSGLGITEEQDMFKYMMDPHIAYRLVKEGAKAFPDVDCVFLTCIASTMLNVVDTLESEINKPVISSCSATLYGILKNLGIPDPVHNYGQALTRPRLFS